MVPIQLHKEKTGDVLNSLLGPFLNAAAALAAGGYAAPDAVDETWRIATGAPSGPFQLYDMIGLTTPYNTLAHDDEGRAEARRLTEGELHRLSATRALRHAPVKVTVIDRANHHLFQPLLYQVETGVLSEGDIAPPTRDALRRQHNTRVLLGNVLDIDLDAHAVVSELLGWRFRLPYDSLIVAAGAAQSYFGNDEFAVHAPGMKTIDDALELRGRIFGAFEVAELETDPARREALLTFAVVGAGPIGVEIAGQIAELSHRALRSNYRAIDPAAARVVLLDAADTVLPPFPKTLQRRARSDLESASGSSCGSRLASPASTPTGSTFRTTMGPQDGSTRRPRSGQRESKRPRSAESSPSTATRSSTAPAASRSGPTAPSPATRKCS